jgi:dTDP-4-amino-4,6-dideoxygalactose transaminase
MTVFNSLGSNYTFKFVLQALFAKNHKNAAIDLKNYLKDRYRGEVYLLYKGREAIQLALEVLNLPKESSVAINGFTCYAVYKAIKNAGFNTIYIDIPATDLNFSTESFRSTLKKYPHIRVLLIQNTLGYPCDIESIIKICKEENIILIEDLAHSIGTVYANGQEAGIVGDFTVLSFSQDKMIDGISGGALIVRNPKYKIKNSRFITIPLKIQKRDRLYPLFTYLIRNTYSSGFGKMLHLVLKKLHALSAPMDALGDYLHELPDWYSRLVHLQFNDLESNILHRKEIAAIYAENLDKKIFSESVVKKINNSSNLRFPIFVQNREKLIQYLKDYNIFISDIWYDAPIAPKKYMKLTNYKNTCQNSEKVSQMILNLPTHINISKSQAKELTQKINIWLMSQ